MQNLNRDITTVQENKVSYMMQDMCVCFIMKLENSKNDRRDGDGREEMNFRKN